MIRYFLDKPVLAYVINLVIVLVGLMAAAMLRVSEYPQIVVPELQVMIPYPNASADVVEQDVTYRVEESLSGTPNLEEMKSTSSPGTATITLKFYPGSDLEAALADVRDRVSQARSSFPDDVKEPVIMRSSDQNNAYFYFELSAENTPEAEIYHMAESQLKPLLRNIPDVSGVEIYGQPYLMDIRFDATKLAAYQISIPEVLAVLRSHEYALPGGTYHEKAPIRIPSSFRSVEQVKAIPIKHNEASIVHLRDVAEVSLVSDDNGLTHINGKPGVILGIQIASDANPLEVSSALYRSLPNITRQLPSAYKLEFSFDKAAFIRTSLAAIKQSVMEAVILVGLVVLLFLRNARAMIIPLLTIPVSLIGGLTFLLLFDCSLNTITLLAMVLAVGLVVDDAIVVLENIHRKISEGRSPFQAAKEGGQEIGFAVIAMTLTLASVYAPVAFVEGIEGQLFREFAIALAGSVLLSGVTAITLSPLMCATFLRHEEAKPLPRLLQNIIRKFPSMNLKALFKAPTQHPGAVAALMLVFAAGCMVLLKNLPHEITPREDRGVIGMFIPPLSNTSLQEALPSLQKAEALLTELPEAATVLAFAGSWGGNAVVKLKPHDQRKRSSIEIVNELTPKANSLPSIDVYPWNWDTGLPGLQTGGDSSSITLAIRTTRSYDELLDVLNQLRQEFDKTKLFVALHHNLHANFAGYDLVLDHDKMTLWDIDPASVAQTAAVFFGDMRPLKFRYEGTLYDVRLRAKDRPNTLRELYVFNREGLLLSAASFASLKLAQVERSLEHLNSMRSATFTLTLANPEDLSKVIPKLEATALKNLPEGFIATFTGAAAKLDQSQATMVLLFLAALVFIFCILAVQFDSFLDPLIILITVPLACGGALLAMKLTGQSMNIFTQIGLITLIGLITKHGILLVEFANHGLASGQSPRAAVIAATQLRLRPIMMTSAAMIFGAIPLAFAGGAGAEARSAIGIVLLGGLSLGTLLTLFVLPTVYIFVKERAPQLGIWAQRQLEKLRQR
ncbi:MAG: efflux RND transporter permease subunit [Holosporales bacterium]